MKILITICARGGSKGIPKKNLKPLNKIPLINYSIKIAKQISSEWGADIGISTDDEEILKTVNARGITTDYERPDFLADDKAGKIDTIKHLLLFEENKHSKVFDYVLDLDVSSPLRNFSDIEKAFKIFIQDKEMLTLFSVNPSNRNPYFNMVEKNKITGYYKTIKIPDRAIKSRQEAIKTYDMNASFYWYRRSFFNQNYQSPITEKSGIYEMDHICFDLDHFFDFKFMEYLLQNNELDFVL